MLQINDWSLFAHPLVLDPLEKLTAAAERTREKDREGYSGTSNARLLAALHKLIFQIIPEDPTRSEYRQGSTLGAARKHWFRAKFGGQRFRLFFRFNSEAKVIIYAWVSDQETLRTYGAKTDAYAVFRSMLDKDNPPDNWAALLKAASETNVLLRLGSVSSESASAGSGGT